MPVDLKLGLVGLDTSHCVAFAKLLNDPAAEHHVAGGRIVAGFPGGSEDFELSRSRVAKFTEELRDQFGIAVFNSPEEVAEQVDAVLITSADGRIHLDQFRKIVGFGKPTFIDKPLAVTSADARAIIETAMEKGVLLMSSSSLRYAQPLVEALRDHSSPIIGADCSGPMALEATQPGLFWYGIHTVEMLYATMGPGCDRLIASRTEEQELVAGTWRDGRIGTVRGHRNASGAFGALIHRKKGFEFVDAYNHPKPAYAGLLERVLAMFRTGTSAIHPVETLEIIRFIEAANESRESGQRVELN